MFFIGLHVSMYYTLFVPEPSCPDGWVDGREIGGHGGCYLFANDGDGLNWNEAKQFCEFVNGYLTDIWDQETQDFIATTSNDFPTVTWWIGRNNSVSTYTHHKSSSLRDF